MTNHAPPGPTLPLDRLEAVLDGYVVLSELEAVGRDARKIRRRVRDLRSLSELQQVARIPTLQKRLQELKAQTNEILERTAVEPDHG